MTKLYNIESENDITMLASELTSTLREYQKVKIIIINFNVEPVARIDFDSSEIPILYPARVGTVSRILGPGNVGNWYPPVYSHVSSPPYSHGSSPPYSHVSSPVYSHVSPPGSSPVSSSFTPFTPFHFRI